MASVVMFRSFQLDLSVLAGSLFACMELQELNLLDLQPGGTCSSPVQPHWNGMFIRCRAEHALVG